MHHTTPLRLAARSGLLCVSILLLGACNEDKTTGPSAMVDLSGTVIAGTDSGTSAPGPMAIVGLSGVTVRHTQSGVSASTNGSGDFVLMRVPSGVAELSFERADVHARGSVMIPSSNASVTASIVGGNAVIVARGHAGAEIEGIVQSVDAGGSTLHVMDQRLGDVTVKTSATTLLRHGNTAMTLGELAAGNRVHVKAMLSEDGMAYLATEIIVQSM